jgi:hypothetical protein
MDCALFVEESRSGAETHTLISIPAAYLCGVFFVNAVAPDMSEPFDRRPFVWASRQSPRRPPRFSRRF